MATDPRPVSAAVSTNTAGTNDATFQSALYTPLPFEEDGLLTPPNARFSAAPTSDSARDSYADVGGQSANASTLPLAERAAEPYRDAHSEGSDTERSDPWGSEKVAAGAGRRRKILIWGGAALATLVVIALAIALPLTLINRNNDNDSGAAGDGGGGDNGPDGNLPPQGAISGGDGSEVTMEDGTTFTYVNKFGGYWWYDPNDPLSNNARPNSWTPPLNESWDYSRNKMFGVNIGGLFVLEPFIVPALFEKYETATPPAVDEWTLSQAMAADTAGGGLSQLENHYDTFITEKDIADIAGAGLNWIRLPVGFWAIETWDGEPFLEKVAWKYILRLFAWCRKYGIRINLDLHAVPGAQNVWNHSGKQGMQNFLNGVMGIANAQRTLGYIRIFAEFISQPEYRDVVPMFSVINEPQAATSGNDPLGQFYYQAYETVRNISGIGEGNGPFVTISDGFSGPSQWATFLTGADRLALDVHPYFAFGSGEVAPVESYPVRACTGFNMVNQSARDFGVTVAGEWSVGINSCGLFLNGVGGTSQYQGDCAPWEDSSTWDQATKDGLRDVALASMDSLQNWFFWTWKIGNSTNLRRVATPLWSYQLGLQEGYIPTDPRDAFGMCASLGATGGAQAPATFSAWQTGGAGAGTFSPVPPAATTQWPPTIIAGVGAEATLLPTYTQTGTVATLPPPTLTAVTGRHTTFDAGDGWFNDADTALGWTTVAGCTYPDQYSAVGIAVPAGLCTGPGGVVAPPVPTLTTTEETDVALPTTTTTDVETTSTTTTDLGLPVIPTETTDLTDTETDTLTTTDVVAPTVIARRGA